MNYLYRSSSKLITILFISIISLITNSAWAAHSENKLNIVPILEADGATMPGFEKEIKESYTDEDGQPIPVVFRGAAKDWEAATWTPEFFAENFGDVEILVMGLNHIKEGMKELPVTFQAKSTVKEHIEDIRKNPLYAGYLLAPAAHNHTKAEDVMETLAVEHLNLATHTNYPQLEPNSSVRVYILFIGSGHSLAPLHSHDSTFLGQFYGTKQALLVNPKEFEKCGCFYDSDYPEEDDDLNSNCMANLEKPDFEKFPGLKEIDVYETILEPGDVLYIPKDWLHEIRAKSTSISISSGF